MIEVSKYQINKFEELRKLSIVKPDLRFAVHIAITYYEFAYHEMIHFNEVIKEFFSENFTENDPRVNTYLSKGWASAYATYALMRTSLDAVKKVNRELLRGVFIQDYHKERVEEIVNIVNDIIKHPMFNNPNSYAYLPSSLDISGKIDVSKWMDITGPCEKIEIQLEKDFYAVRNYLEYVADLYKSNLSPQNLYIS